MRRSRLPAAYCPLLASLVDDCCGRKAGCPNICSSSFHLECPPYAQGQVLEGLSAHVLFKILIQKPQCSEKTVSKPSTQSTLSRASYVMQASTREEGFFQQTGPLVLELK